MSPVLVINAIAQDAPRAIAENDRFDQKEV